MKISDFLNEIANKTVERWVQTSNLEVSEGVHLTVQRGCLSDERGGHPVTPWGGDPLEQTIYIATSTDFDMF